MWWKLTTLTVRTLRPAPDEPDPPPVVESGAAATAWLVEPPHAGDVIRLLEGDPRRGPEALRPGQCYAVLLVERPAVRVDFTGTVIDPVARDAAGVGTLYVRQVGDGEWAARLASLAATP